MMIGLAGLEIASLVLGVSIYSNMQNFVAAAFHMGASVALLCFMFAHACVDNVWIIFGVCSCVPFLAEIVALFRICVCQNLPAW